MVNSIKFSSLLLPLSDTMPNKFYFDILEPMISIQSYFQQMNSENIISVRSVVWAKCLCNNENLSGLSYVAITEMVAQEVCVRLAAICENFSVNHCRSPNWNHLHQRWLRENGFDRLSNRSVNLSEMTKSKAYVWMLQNVKKFSMIILIKCYLIL